MQPTTTEFVARLCSRYGINREEIAIRGNTFDVASFVEFCSIQTALIIYKPFSNRYSSTRG